MQCTHTFSSGMSMSKDSSARIMGLPTMDWSRSSSNGDLGGDTSFGGDRLVGDP